MAKQPTTISVYELFDTIPNAEAARLYLESRLWPNGVVCPVCGSGERITTRVGGFYRCNACKEDFTVRTGTIFERSHIPLNKWIYAMYMLVTARKGISSLQLAKEIGVTQKSAWFMLHRLREACQGNWRQLRGIIEIDETEEAAGDPDPTTGAPDHCACSHDGRGELVTECQEHLEIRDQRDALLSLVEMWQEVDRSEAPTARRYIALTDRRDTWLARHRAETCR